MEKEIRKYKFKKGQILSLDNIYDIQGLAEGDGGNLRMMIILKKL